MYLVQEFVDGHTLAESMADAESISGIEIKHAHVDKGYRKHDYQGEGEVHVSGAGGKKSRWERLWRRRRSAVEPVIGHAKHDNRMIRNYLKGPEGDKANAVVDCRKEGNQKNPEGSIVSNPNEGDWKRKHLFN